MPRSIGVFVSSSKVDLLDYRRAVRRAIDAIDGFHVIGMEEFGSRVPPSVDTSVDEVRKSDVVVLVLAGCYGSVPPEEQKSGRQFSYTRCEFEAARVLGIPVLPFEIDLQYAERPIGDNDRLADHALTGEEFARLSANVARLREFKGVVRDLHTVDLFRDPEDLARKVVQALAIHAEQARATVRTPSAASISTDSAYVERNEAKAEFDRQLATGDGICAFVGASGSGKTQFLRARACDARTVSRPVAYIDLEVCLDRPDYSLAILEALDRGMHHWLDPILMAQYSKKLTRIHNLQHASDLNRHWSEQRYEPSRGSAYSGQRPTTIPAPPRESQHVLQETLDLATDSIELLLSAVPDGALLLFDTTESLAEPGLRFLMQHVVHRLIGRAQLVLAGTEPILEAGETLRSDSHFPDEMTVGEAQDALRRLGLPDAEALELSQRLPRYPLFLGLLTDLVRQRQLTLKELVALENPLDPRLREPLRTKLARLIKHIRDERYRHILTRGAVLRFLERDALEHVLECRLGDDDYGRLRGASWTSIVGLGGRLRFHPHLRAALHSQLRLDHPDEFQRLHQRAYQHYASHASSRDPKHSAAQYHKRESLYHLAITDADRWWSSFRSEFADALNDRDLERCESLAESAREALELNDAMRSYEKRIETLARTAGALHDDDYSHLRPGLRLLVQGAPESYPGEVYADICRWFAETLLEQGGGSDRVHEASALIARAASVDPDSMAQFESEFNFARAESHESVVAHLERVFGRKEPAPDYVCAAAARFAMTSSLWREVAQLLAVECTKAPETTDALFALTDLREAVGLNAEAEVDLERHHANILDPLSKVEVGLRLSRHYKAGGREAKATALLDGARQSLRAFRAANSSVADWPAWRRFCRASFKADLDGEVSAAVVDLQSRDDLTEEARNDLALWELRADARRQGIDAVVDRLRKTESPQRLLSMLIDSARGEEREGNWREAIRIYQQLGEMKHVQEAAALERVGSILADELQEHGEAEKFYRRSLDVRPNRVHALVGLLGLLLRRREWVGAERICDRMKASARSEDNRFDAAVHLARYYAAKGEYGTAVALIKQFEGAQQSQILMNTNRVCGWLEYDGFGEESSELWVRVAADVAENGAEGELKSLCQIDRALQVGDVDTASAILSNVDNVSKESRLWLDLLRVEVFVRTKRDGALDALLATAPPRLQFTMLDEAAAALRRHGAHEHAIQLLRRIGDVDWNLPGSADIRANALETAGYIALGEMDDAAGALTLFERALGLNPMRFAAAKERANILLRAGHLGAADKAVMRLERLAVSSSQREEVCGTVAALRVRQQRIPEALAEIRRYASLDLLPEYAFRVARIAANMGSLAEALMLQDSAEGLVLELDPDFRAGRICRLSRATRSGDLAQANSELVALGADRGSDVILHACAELELLNAGLEAAIDTRISVSEPGSGRLEVASSILDSLVDFGRWDAAVKGYTELAAMFPEKAGDCWALIARIQIEHFDRPDLARIAYAELAAIPKWQDAADLEVGVLDILQQDWSSARDLIDRVLARTTERWARERAKFLRVGLSACEIGAAEAVSLLRDSVGLDGLVAGARNVASMLRLAPPLANQLIAEAKKMTYAEAGDAPAGLALGFQDAIAALDIESADALLTRWDEVAGESWANERLEARLLIGFLRNDLESVRALLQQMQRGAEVPSLIRLASELEELRTRNAVQAALSAYELLAAKDHDQQDDALLKAGSLSLTLGDTDRARSFFERALEMNPRFLEALTGLLQLECSLHHWSVAATLADRLERSSRSEEERRIARLWRSFTVLAQGRFEEGIGLLRGAAGAAGAELVPCANFVLGNLMSAGKENIAFDLKKHLEGMMIEEDPQGASGLSVRLQRAVSTGALDEAEALLSQLGPDFKERARFEAHILVRRDQVDQAYLIAKRAAGSDGAVGFLMTVAASLEAVGEWAAVVELYRCIANIESGGDRASVFERIGDLRRDKLGDSDGAIIAYNQALRVEPGRPSVIGELFTTHLLLGQVDLAESQLAKLASSDGANEPHRLLLAKLTAALAAVRGRPGDGVSELRRVFEGIGFMIALGEVVAILDRVGSKDVAATVHEIGKKRFMESETNDPLSNLLRVEHFLATKEIDRAEALLDTIAKNLLPGGVGGELTARAEIAAVREGAGAANRLLEAAVSGQQLILAKLHVAASLERHGQAAAAAELYRHLGEIEHGQRAAAWRKVCALLAVSDPAEAEQALRNAQLIDPDNTDIQFEFLEFHVRQSRWTDLERGLLKLKDKELRVTERSRRDLIEATLLIARNRLESAFVLLNSLQSRVELAPGCDVFKVVEAGFDSSRHADLLSSWRDFLRTRQN